MAGIMRDPFRMAEYYSFRPRYGFIILCGDLRPLRQRLTVIPRQPLGWMR
jgi:hypothetical protein